MFFNVLLKMIKRRCQTKRTKGSRRQSHRHTHGS